VIQQGVRHETHCHAVEPALMPGFILGPMFEENFRRALQISNGSFAPFVTRPVRR